MENQHRKISGYRELSQQEIDLMNCIKEKGAELLALQSELAAMIGQQHFDKSHGPTEEFESFEAAEPMRWANIGKTNIQTGIMALVRAVAQPAGV